MFAAGPRQAVGDQHQHPADPIVVRVFFRQQLGPPPTGIEQFPEAQLVEEMPGHEHRPPAAGVEHFDRTVLCELPSQLCLIVVAFKKAIEHRQDSFERITSSEVGDDLLLDLSVFAHGADDANILMHGAVG